MNQYAVLGWPVEHSLSPPMHNEAFAKTGLNSNYGKVPCPPEDFASIIAGLKKQSYSGWNCTVPLKYEIFPFLDEIDEEARLAESVNTVVKRGDKYHGYSTDGYGMIEAIRESAGMEVAGKKILFIGAGGAARAVAVSMARAGAKEIRIVNRTVSKAAQIASIVKEANSKTQSQAFASASISADENPAKGVDIIIQCTSLGLKADAPMPFPIELIDKDILVMDMIYGHTAFQEQCREHGNDVFDGLGMLLHQGVRAWEIWTEQDAPVEIMRAALIKAKAAKS